LRITVLTKGKRKSHLKILREVKRGLVLKGGGGYSHQAEPSLEIRKKMVGRYIDWSSVQLFP
jgi:hypothetical protein